MSLHLFIDVCTTNTAGSKVMPDSSCSSEALQIGTCSMPEYTSRTALVASPARGVIYVRTCSNVRLFLAEDS